MRSSKRLVLSPLQPACPPELTKACMAQHGARQLRPVLPSRLAPTVDLMEFAAVIGLGTSLVAASSMGSSKRLVQSPLQPAFRPESIIAIFAQHGARQLRPVLPPRLAPTVDLMELA